MSNKSNLNYVRQKLLILKEYNLDYNVTVKIANVQVYNIINFNL